MIKEMHRIALDKKNKKITISVTVKVDHFRDFLFKNKIEKKMKQ